MRSAELAAEPSGYREFERDQERQKGRQLWVKEILKELFKVKAKHRVVKILKLRVWYENLQEHFVLE